MCVAWAVCGGGPKAATQLIGLAVFSGPCMSCITLFLRQTGSEGRGTMCVDVISLIVLIPVLNAVRAGAKNFRVLAGARGVYCMAS